jgi:hypothetical protein
MVDVAPPFTENEAGVAAAFVGAVTALRDSAVTPPVVAAINGGNVTGAVNRLAWDAWGDELSGFIRYSLSELRLAAETAGEEGVTFSRVAPPVRTSPIVPGTNADQPPLPVAGGPAAVATVSSDNFVRWRYVDDDPAAVAWARQHGGRRIVQLGEEVRTVARREVTRGLADGLRGEDVAVRLRSVIPFTERQQVAAWAGATAAATQVLEAGGSAGQAKVAYDRSLEVRVARALEVRASAIARTEMATAANQGLVFSWWQASRGNLVAPTALRRWSGGGGNTCERCSSLIGRTAGLYEMFDVGLFAPPAHPNCYCSAVLVSPPRSGRGMFSWLSW